MIFANVAQHDVMLFQRCSKDSTMDNLISQKATEVYLDFRKQRWLYFKTFLL